MREYEEGHKMAIEHARKGKHPSSGNESELHKAGYRQGLTQAHNLRIPIKEHELPYWAKK